MTDRGKKLLVIEDVSFSREALEGMLTHLGCEVDSVHGVFMSENWTQESGIFTDFLCSL